ncbi:MAG: trypsin-like serine protease [Pseudomonadota bacterium]
MLREDRTTGLSALLFTLLSLAGCAAPVDGLDEDSENVGETGQAITRGTLVNGQDPYAVKLEFADGTQCSGTKIATRRFLTAGHCVTEVFPNSTVTITNADSGTGGSVFTVSNVYIYPGQWAALASGIRTDIAIVQVHENSPNIPIWTALRTEYVPDGLPTGWATGFGCDLDAPSHNGKKQFTQITTALWNDPAWHAGYIFAPGNPWPALCSGDAGGPLYFWNGQAWELGGVNALSIGDTRSWFTRIGRVRFWIENPVVNDFRNGMVGSLLNRAGNNCITETIPSSSFAQMGYCDLRDIPHDLAYWRLVGSPESGFRIENTKTGRCLQAPVPIVVHANCNPTSRGQLWKFVSPANADGTTYYRIQNQLITDQCIAPFSSGTHDSLLKLTPCSSSSTPDDQSFAFVP